MRTKLLGSVAILAMMGCASNQPKELAEAEKSVARAESKDADDLTPRMMELANQQLEKAEDLWEEAQDAREDKDYAKADSLTNQSMKLAASAQALAEEAVAIKSNVKKWDKNPSEYQANSEELNSKINELQAKLSSRPDIVITEDMSPEAAMSLVDSMPVAFFPTNKSEPKDDFVPNTKRLASYLKANDGVSIKLTGYADPRGEKQYNEELAKRRAMAVQSILQNEGVPQDRIEVASAGEVGTQQADASQLQLYRKVEATLINKSDIR